MKVKELIESLKDISLEAEVVVSSDGEGNDFSPLSGVDGSFTYVPTSTWSGYILPKEEFESEGHTDGLEACVLWPTN